MFAASHESTPETLRRIAHRASRIAHRASRIALIFHTFYNLLLFYSRKNCTKGAFADHRAAEPSRSRWDSAPASSTNQSGKQTGFLVVRLILGVILLTAAGVKLADDGSGVAGAFAHPLWRLILVEAEAFLGGWLLLGLAPRILWLVTLVFFTLLAGASVYMGSIGQPSCGCFGNKVHVQPWCMFALDLFLVAGLVWCQPSQAARIEVHSAIVKAILAVVTGSGVILAVVFGGLAWLT